MSHERSRSSVFKGESIGLNAKEITLAAGIVKEVELCS